MLIIVFFRRGTGAAAMQTIPPCPCPVPRAPWPVARGPWPVPVPVPVPRAPWPVHRAPWRLRNEFCQVHSSSPPIENLESALVRHSTASSVGASQHFFFEAALGSYPGGEWGANFFHKLGANWLAPFVRGQLRAFFLRARHGILKNQIGLNTNMTAPGAQKMLLARSVQTYW